jgi:hypothetical protein
MGLSIGLTVFSQQNTTQAMERFKKGAAPVPFSS